MNLQEIDKSNAKYIDAILEKGKEYGFKESQSVEILKILNAQKNLEESGFY